MPERDEGPLCTDSDPAAEGPPAPVPAGPQAPVPGMKPAADEDPPGFVPARVGCRSELRGWAGAHLHGAVRPRRRAPGRGRPPGRWC
jgi:hypothetical protein